MKLRCSTGLALLLSLCQTLLFTAGCNNETPLDQGSPPADSTQTPVELPNTEADFLALLQPLPGGAEAIEVHYAIRGTDPASTFDGEMSVLIAVGGSRRETWELRSSLDGAQIVTKGSTVATADQVWSGVEGTAGELVDRPLASLAWAFRAMPPEQQRSVVDGISGWHTALARQRAEQPGEVATVAGVRCLKTRIAAQNLCLWEETGLFLSYSGAAFTITATEIDLAPQGDLTVLLALPKSAGRAKRIAVEPFDATEVLEQLVAGNYSAMAKILAPGLHLPALHETREDR